MDTAQAATIVAMLVAAYPQATLEPASVEIYTRAIAELDDADAAVETARVLIRHGKNFPSVSEIRQNYQRVKEHRTLEADSEQRRLESARSQPPSPEALASIRNLAKQWGSADLAAFADRIDPSPVRAIPS